MNDAPLALMRLASARVYSRLLTTPPRPLGLTKIRSRKQFQPWRAKMAMASSGLPSSLKTPPRCSMDASAEISPPTMNVGGDLICARTTAGLLELTRAKQIPHKTRLGLNFAPDA